MNAVEYNCFILDVFIDCFLKIHGMFCPMHGLLFMMRDMVPIVPAFVVVLRIDAGDAVFVRISRIIMSDKSMLRPIPHHSDQAVQEEWNNKDH